MFKFTVKGIDSIDKDYQKQLKRINRAIPAGLAIVRDELVEGLQQHVENDVYAAYKPKDYERTGAMADDSSIITSVKGNVLDFEYRFDTQSEPPYFEDSDDVISAIQDSSYLWNVAERKIPKRPFWDNFYNEQIVDGKADEALASGMNAYMPDLEAKGERGAIIPDGQDSTDLHDPINRTGRVNWGNSEDEEE